MQIAHYTFGRIIVSGQVYTRDLIVHPGGVEANWRRQEGHQVTVADLDRIWPLDPEVLVLGTGMFGRVKVDRAVIDALEERGVRVEALPTRKACTRYEELRNEGRRVVAALHLTC